MKPTEEYEIVNTYKNYKYAVWFNDVQGYRCGYVQIPENHKFFEKSHRDCEIDSVQLTFSGHIKCLDGWFIGWDHHHSWDGIDEEGIRKAHSDLPEDKLEEMINIARSSSGDCYCLISYTDDVEHECHRVIDELIKIAKT